MQFDLAIVPQGELQLIRKIQQAKNCLQKMIAIFPAPDHMQEQIQLGRSRANELIHFLIMKFLTHGNASVASGIPAIYHNFYLKITPFKQQ